MGVTLITCQCTLYNGVIVESGDGKQRRGRDMLPHRSAGQLRNDVVLKEMGNIYLCGVSCMVEVMEERMNKGGNSLERKAEGGRDICSKEAIGNIRNDIILKTDGKVYLWGVSPSTY